MYVASHSSRRLRRRNVTPGSHSEPSSPRRTGCGRRRRWATARSLDVAELPLIVGAFERDLVRERAQLRLMCVVAPPADTRRADVPAVALDFVRPSKEVERCRWIPLERPVERARQRCARIGGCDEVLVADDGDLRAGRGLV